MINVFILDKGELVIHRSAAQSIAFHFFDGNTTHPTEQSTHLGGR